MAKRRSRRSRQGTQGTPSSIVLYRTPTQWRFNLHLSSPAGLACGALDHPSADSTPDEAQTAALAEAELFADRPLAIAWQPDEQPDWWAGTITPAIPTATTPEP
ncbi:hypothetical protein ACGFRB_06370 [Streptomyces sp. NPDC048718]|uniref:hypothetical protein n=1 Tax=Streptomyces sp. NPDC048718 TaxID=3365587 RepID=UPI00371C8ECA